MNLSWKSTDGVDGDQIVEDYVDGAGNILARIEVFVTNDRTCYPMAVNEVAGRLERHGPCNNLARAMAWCERVANGRPEPGDERPPFYFACDRDPCSWRECFFKGCQ